MRSQKKKNDGISSQSPVILDAVTYLKCGILSRDYLTRFEPVTYSFTRLLVFNQSCRTISFVNIARSEVLLTLKQDIVFMDFPEGDVGTSMSEKQILG